LDDSPLPRTREARRGFAPSRLSILGLPPSHQLQLLDSAPTFNLLLQFPRRLATSAALTPNQLNWPTFRGVPRSNSPVVPLNALLHIIRNPDVERSISASRHVAEPTCPATLHRSAGLFHFLVRRVLPARIAKLLRLQTVGVLLLVFRRRVVAVLAIPALQRNRFPHAFVSLPASLLTATR
jgi:hypothetical protein